MFKVGDRVRCVDVRCAEKELEFNKIYTISGLNGAGCIYVKELETHSAYSNKRFEKVNTEEPIFNQYKCKFKVGDRVKRTNGQFADMGKGDIGTIRGIGSFVGAKKPQTLTFKEFKGVHDSKNFELYKPTREEEIKLEIQKLQDELKKIEDNKEVELDFNKCINTISKSVPNNEKIKFIRKGNSITCTIYNRDTDKILGKGTAKTCPEDVYDESVGLRLSFFRACENLNKRIVHKIIKETF